MPEQTPPPQPIDIAGFQSEMESYAGTVLLDRLKTAYDSSETVGFAGNLTGAASRLFGAIRVLIDKAEQKSNVVRRDFGQGISGMVKKLAVKAGATILIDGIVPLIPLGAASLAGPLIRPILRRLLYWISDAVIDNIVSDRNMDNPL